MPTRMVERHIRICVDLAVVIVGEIALVLIAVQSTSVLRPTMTLLAISMGCGWAIVGWIRLHDWAYLATLTLAAGVSLMMLVGLCEVEVGVWHPVETVVVVLAVAGASNVCLLLHDVRHVD